VVDRFRGVGPTPQAATGAGLREDAAPGRERRPA
jgi:hypothetical protein